MNSENKLIGAGLLTAITFIMLHYTSFGSNRWNKRNCLNIFLDENLFRPYLIAMTILILGFAWYQN
jgi:hypothetical protein